jgi:RNA polymerase sigma-70 factor, ECF subfamily
MLSSSLPARAPIPSVPWSEMSSHRSYLVRFARRKLLDASLAEDLVHDVFEAVASGRARFDARSSLRTWLTAILKHKIVDLVRQRRCGHSRSSPDRTSRPSSGSGSRW